MKCQCAKVDTKAGYKCGPCHLKNKTYEWAVITYAPDNGDGNMANYLLDFDRRGASKFLFGGSMGPPSFMIGQGRKKYKDLTKIPDERYEKVRSRKLAKAAHYYYSYEGPVFSTGEMFPVSPDFRRGILCGRKPDKWFVYVEYFKASELDKALNCAMRAIQDEPKTAKKYEAEQIEHDEAMKKIRERPLNQKKKGKRAT